ncbi:hypothetical protein [Haloarcula hispanica]|uniref:hypothetical protein n=1 Tax=Haloarcula hispanica TaxID=51589 RepID=UPI001F1992D4|nr:hypothetical protein [Haloarcula hispanica]
MNDDLYRAVQRLGPPLPCSHPVVVENHEPREHADDDGEIIDDEPRSPVHASASGVRPIIATPERERFNHR